MPITYRIDGARNLVQVELAGDLSIDDLRNALLQILEEHPDLGSLRYLGRFSRVTANFNASDLVQYQKWRIQYPRFGPMAVVAVSDYEFGMARMFELGTNAVGGAELRVFRSLVEAREWLGLEVE